MIVAKIPANEVERIKALNDYNILDTLPEKEYDDITRIASEICQVPIALISLIDSHRQWFKSHQGLNSSETPREQAFCAHAILKPEAIFEVPNAQSDIRFQENPLVTGDLNLVFYAGAPLVTPEGLALGTLCIIDHSPKELSQNQKNSLAALANQVVRLFELRKKNAELEKMKEEIEKRNADLVQFSNVVTHDIRSPLAGIISLTSVLIDDYSNKLDEKGERYIYHVNQSSKKLLTFVDGLLQFYKSDLPLKDNIQSFYLHDFLESLIKLIDVDNNFNIKIPQQNTLITTNKIGLEQIFLNLLTNSIKYNDKNNIEITIDYSDGITHHNFSVTDNGMGIKTENLSKIFEPFTILGQKDRSGNMGTGIGLSSVKNIIEKLNGKLSVESEYGTGSKFSFTIDKSTQNYL